VEVVGRAVLFVVAVENVVEGGDGGIWKISDKV
jgi:hypothetical protein